MRHVERNALLSLLALLSIADVATTLIGLAQGHYELNPLARHSMRVVAPEIVLTVTKSVGWTLIYLLQRPLKDSWAKPGLIGWNVVMAGVVAWNAGVIW